MQLGSFYETIDLPDLPVMLKFAKRVVYRTWPPFLFLSRQGNAGRRTCGFTELRPTELA